MTSIDTSRRSPNHSSRGGHPIGMIVMHATGGSAASALNWLCAPASQVSSHVVIDKSGHIYELVPDDLTAWHAGVSQWRGLEVWGTAPDGRRIPSINPVSLGIELENADTGHDPYPEAQLVAAAWLCREKIARYQITRANVARHLDVAIPHGRKSDPAGLDWDAFLARVFTPPAPVTPAAGLLYRAKVTSWVRPVPRLNVDRDGSVPQGTLVTVLEIEAGDRVVHPVYGTSDQWARLDRGYVWLPQLAAVR